MLREAAQFRRRFFDLGDLPEQMAKIADLGDVNITFVTRTRARYFEYARCCTCRPSASGTCLSFLPCVRPCLRALSADAETNETIGRDYLLAQASRSGYLRSESVSSGRRPSAR
jgi:hypothetical protein